MRYYQILTDDERFADRWFLGEPLSLAAVEIDAREFRYGRPYLGPLPVHVPIRQEGRQVAFNLGAFDMPLVTVEIATILDALAPSDIERFPVMIEEDIPGYEIVNAVSTRQCVDETRSIFRKWGPTDHRSDKVGEYREFERLVLDASGLQGTKVFRIWGSVVELLVSEDIKEAIEAITDLGIVFEEVPSNEGM